VEATLVLLLAIVGFDLVVIGRRTGPVTLRDASRWVVLYVGLAALFGLALVWLGPSGTGTEFFAGYLTEYSLSVDNLFVFLLIMTRFAVPAAAQDKVLYVGIVLSMLLRAVLIFAGAAAIAAASWTFVVFGVFLVYTALRLILSGEDEAEFEEGVAVRALRRLVPITPGYEGRRLAVRRAGRLTITPLFLAVAAIAVANVVFAVDSIPAIFGLTTNAYVVLAANAFALLGLRQLYFVVESLLTRLRFLKAGLVVILGFIGVKLVLEAMWETHVRHLASMDVPQVSTSFSLAVIVGVLALVTVASLAADRISGEGLAAEQVPLGSEE
jgi:tellurite resistance protein TerC